MMEFRFVKQQYEDGISTLDVIELYNCSQDFQPGQYTVADVDPESGDVTLLGMGLLQGYVSVINMLWDDGPD